MHEKICRLWVTLYASKKLMHNKMNKSQTSSVICLNMRLTISVVGWRSASIYKNRKQLNKSSIIGFLKSLKIIIWQSTNKLVWNLLFVDLSVWWYMRNFRLCLLDDRMLYQAWLRCSKIWCLKLHFQQCLLAQRRMFWFLPIFLNLAELPTTVKNV